MGGDAVPAPEWHRLTLAWEVLQGPAELDVAALRRDLGPGGPLHDLLLERITAGRTTEWNGSNYVGVLDADAAQADEELRARLADDPDRFCTRRTVWAAADWLALELSIPGLSADTTDAELEEVVERLDTEARGEHVVLQNLRAELERRRQELRDGSDCRERHRDRGAHERERVGHQLGAGGALTRDEGGARGRRTPLIAHGGQWRAGP